MDARRPPRLTCAQRRYLAGEFVLAALLLALFAATRGHSGALGVIGIVALGYTIALVAHIAAVLSGWGRTRRRT